MKNTEKTMEKIVALCKGRGFVYPGSEIYGGLANTWDYGPLGIELKNNIKKAWFKKFVQENKYNVGLDYAFFSNSLYGTVDAYIKKVKDMLINPAYLGSVGEGGASWQNGPSLENKGMEFTVGYRNKTPFGMTYNINANLDFFRNKVTYLPETTTGS